MTDADQDQVRRVVDLKASVGRVWRALTDHEEFGAWFRVRLDGPFRVGSLTTGWITYPGHEDMKWESTTEQMVPERLFVFSWPPSAVDPDNDYGPEAKVTVEFRLESTEAGTRLTITESGFLQFPERKRLEILRSNEEGWRLQAGHIAAHVEG